MGSNLRKWQLPALISLGMSFFWLLLRRGHIALFFAPVETGAGLPGPYLAAVVLALAVALADALAQGFFSRIVVRHAWILVFVGGISAVLGLVAGILGSESPPAVALGKAVCYAALLCGLAWGWGDARFREVVSARHCQRGDFFCPRNLGFSGRSISRAVLLCAAFCGAARILFGTMEGG